MYFVGLFEPNSFCLHCLWGVKCVITEINVVVFGDSIKEGDW